MCKLCIKVCVRNITNEHTHFERVINYDDNVVVPYDSIVKTLLWLYQGQNVKVVIESALNLD